MLASCFKKQMQLEFMFSSLSEKRNQSKLPLKLRAVIQILHQNPQKEAGSREWKSRNAPRRTWHQWHEGWQLGGWALGLKANLLFSSAPEEGDCVSPVRYWYLSFPWWEEKEFECCIGSNIPFLPPPWFTIWPQQLCAPPKLFLELTPTAYGLPLPLFYHNIIYFI